MSAHTRVVLVTGLSGAGKSSILRALEDLGFEAIDNPPLLFLERLITEQATHGARHLAVGVDVRSSGFDAGKLLDARERLHHLSAYPPELIFVTAEETVLLQRYTETRRRHPLAPHGRVSDGISAEIDITAQLREAADLVIDTSDLPLPALRRIVEQRFGTDQNRKVTLSLVSFAFPAGLPREADMVFDARFLRNPHYDPILKPKTGLDADVRAYVEADPDYPAFMDGIAGLLGTLLPRFMQEGKKYVTLAVGCTGGRHRSVTVVERLAEKLTLAECSTSSGSDWTINVTHRELARAGGQGARRNDDGTPLQPQARPNHQAQEA